MNFTGGRSEGRTSAGDEGISSARDESITSDIVTSVIWTSNYYISPWLSLLEARGRHKEDKFSESHLIILIRELFYLLNYLFHLFVKQGEFFSLSGISSGTSSGTFSCIFFLYILYSFGWLSHPHLAL